MVMLLLFAVIMINISFVPGFNDRLAKGITNTFGYGNDGKTLGKLLAVPLLAVIYFAVVMTVGTKSKFEKYTAAFMQYPDELKAKANAKLLTPFFILLVIVVGLAIRKL